MLSPNRKMRPVSEKQDIFINFMIIFLTFLLLYHYVGVELMR